MLKAPLALAIALILAPSSLATWKPLALIYKGPGSCVEKCSESLASIAEGAGFQVRYVGPKEIDPAIFHGASVWLQPGGRVYQQNIAMEPELKQNIFRFVQRGGGYLGFCAGALLASQSYGWKDREAGNVSQEGLNFFPGSSTIYWKGKSIEMIETVWQGVLRHLYWELGPVYKDTKGWGPEIEIISRYPDDGVATIRRQFGNGKVYVTAFHPEAPRSWRDDSGLLDRDGLDFDLVRDMIEWVNPDNPVLPER